MVCITDDLTIALANSEAARFLGVELSAIVQRPITDIVPGFGATLPLPTSHPLPLHSGLGGRAVNLAELPGDSPGFRSIMFTDPAVDWATNLQQAQTALRDAESRNLAIVNTVADAIITITADGIVETFNPAAEYLFGYASAEVSGRNVSMLMPSPFHEQHDGYLRNYRDTGIARIIGLGRVVEGRRSDGSAFPMELAVSETPLADRLLFTGIVRDITERKRQEGALLEAEARMRAIVSTAVDGIILIDETGTIEAFNPAAERIFGYQADEVLGRNVSMLMPPVFAREHDQYLRNFVETGIAKIIGIGREVIGLNKDGSTFPMDLAVSDTTVNGRRLFTGIVRDISDRKRAEAALREAQKLESLGVLAGGIAHDFNNLLVGILGHAGLALEELPAESPARHTIEQIELAGRRCAELSHQMLAYSGKGKFVVGEIDLSTLVREMSHLMRASVKKGVTIRYNLSPNLPRVTADATQVRQVVMNLVINASDAIGDVTGAINISTGVTHANRDYLSEAYLTPDLPPGDYVYLEVSDTGSGITPEARARIFDPFFTTKFTGRGLGLAVVLGIVRGHQGAIKVYSEPGHGSTFKFLLPAATGPDDAETDDERANAPAWSTNALVLVIDDDEVVRDVTTRLLQRWGITVITAENGRDGLDVFHQHERDISLVLLDLTMPQMDGEKTFNQIRATNTTTPIVMMSGYSTDDMTQRLGVSGVSGMIQKPYDVKKLKELIQGLLEERLRPT